MRITRLPSPSDNSIARRQHQPSASAAQELDGARQQRHCGARSSPAATRRVQHHVHPEEALMVSRRTFLSLVAASMSTPRAAFAQPETRRVALYANVGADLTHYDVDVAGAALTKRATVTLPAGVQYAWPHVSRR